MEISRKKITDEEIYEKEKALAERASEIAKELSPKFEELGYELDTELTRANESIEDDEEKALAETNILTDIGAYKDGYISNAKITIKRPKTAEEEELEAAEEELLSASELSLLDEELDEEHEQEVNDVILARAKRELERSIAFTTVFFVRVYKTFWHETVSIGDDAEMLLCDLNEFYEKLLEKKEAGEI